MNNYNCTVTYGSLDEANFFENITESTKQH